MKNIASIIDQTFLKKGADSQEIKKVCDEAKQYGFRALCVYPEHTKWSKEFLAGSGVKVTTLIDDPTGTSLTEDRIVKVNQAKDDGSGEIELVMQVDAFKNKQYDEVKEDLGVICKIL